MWLKSTAGQTPQTDRCRIPYRTPNRSGRQEPMVSRIYVEKKPGFAVEAQQLTGELTEILGIKGIEALRIIHRYAVEGIDEELFRSCVPTVFSEPQVDVTYDELPASDGAVFAVEFLPGQFDQRADSASECVQLISQGERPLVRSARVYLLEGALTDEQLAERRRELEAGDGYVAHRDRKVSQALKAYAAFARSADKGATRDPELINKLSGLA